MKDVFMRRLAKPMLLLAALIWGSSFFIMKGAVDDLPIFYLLALRFTGGAVLMALLCIPKWKKLDLGYLWRGALFGGLLFAAYSVQTFGLAGTTPSKNAFLTAVYCVLVPFFYWITAGRRPDRFHLLAALLCVAGVGLVSLSGRMTVTWGDGLTLCAAVLFALHIVAVSTCSPGRDIYLLTTLQFAFSALLSWVFGGIFQSPPPLSLLLEPSILGPLLYLTVFATTVALLFQNVGQVWSDPSSASILLSLESVFGVLCSVIFYHEQLTARMALGFVCIFTAVLCSETKFSFLKKRG